MDGGLTKKDNGETLTGALLSYKWVLYFFGLSIICFLIGNFVATMFMAFGYGILSMGICLLAYLFIVEKVVGVVDDLTEIITNKNMAYAIYLLAIAIVVIGAYVSAFLVFLALKDPTPGSGF